MNTLPPEIILNIYSYLHTNTLLRLRKINKLHKELVQIHFFSNIFKKNDILLNSTQRSLLIHLYCIFTTYKEILKKTFGRCIIHIVRTQLNKGTFKISESPRFNFKYARWKDNDINYNILLYNNENFSEIGNFLSNTSLDINFKIWKDENMMEIYAF